MKAFALNLNKRQGDPCFQIESRNDGNINWSENKIGRSLAGSLGMTWELGGYGGQKCFSMILSSRTSVRDLFIKFKIS